MKGYRYYKRAFLNRPGKESVGFILASLSNEGRWAELTIGDCSRHINLSLGLDKEDRANTLQKLWLLRNTVDGLIDAIYDAPRIK